MQEEIAKNAIFNNRFNKEALQSYIKDDLLPKLDSFDITFQLEIYNLLLSLQFKNISYIWIENMV